MNIFKKEQLLTCASLPYEFSSAPREVKVYAKGPEAGANSDTGIMLIVHGQGEHPNSRTYREMREEWSNRYNLIALSVEYLGSGFLSRPPNVALDQTFLSNLQKYYRPEEFQQAVVNGSLLLERLPPKDLPGLIVRGVRPEEPVDGGYIQAMDCLCAAQFMLKTLEAENLRHNPRRIYIYGFDLGGHIAQMCNKLAPSTFALVCDVGGSAFVNSERMTVGLSRVTLGNIRVTVNYGSHYSNNPSDPNFFTPDMMEIRNLLNPDHLERTLDQGPEQTLVMFHGARDTVVPPHGKTLLFNSLLHFGGHAILKLFYEEDVDGVIVQQPDHNLGDRKKMVEKYAGKFLEEKSPHVRILSYPTNFERQNEVYYPTPGGHYYVNYKSTPVEITFTPNK